MAVHEKHSTNQHQKQYMHLTVFERGQIKAFRDAGWTIRAIARRLHRSPGTISRELKRGSVCLLYTSPSPRDGKLSRMPSSA